MVKARIGRRPDSRWRDERRWSIGYRQFGYPMRKRIRVCVAGGRSTGEGGGTIVGFVGGVYVRLVLDGYVILLVLITTRALANFVCGKTFFISDPSAKEPSSKPARACEACYETVFPLVDSPMNPESPTSPNSSSFLAQSVGTSHPSNDTVTSLSKLPAWVSMPSLPMQGSQPQALMVDLDISLDLGHTSPVSLVVRLISAYRERRTEKFKVENAAASDSNPPLAQRVITRSLKIFRFKAIASLPSFLPHRQPLSTPQLKKTQNHQFRKKRAMARRSSGHHLWTNHHNHQAHLLEGKKTRRGDPRGFHCPQLHSMRQMSQQRPRVWSPAPVAAGVAEQVLLPQVRMQMGWE